LHKGIETFVVDHRGDAAEDDDLSFSAEPFGDVLRGDPPQGGIVTRDVDVFNPFFCQAPVDDGDKDPLLFHKLDGPRQGIRLEVEDHQRVDLMNRHQVLQVVDLLRGAAGRDDDDFEVGISRHEPFRGHVCPVVDTARPPVGRRGNRDADLDLFLGQDAGDREEETQEDDGNTDPKGLLSHGSHSLRTMFPAIQGNRRRTRQHAGHSPFLTPRCIKTAAMMMMPCTAPLRYWLIALVKLRMLPIMLKMMAPTTVLQIRPDPPLSAVPPMITEAMASSSHKSPVVPDADPSRGTYRI